MRRQAANLLRWSPPRLFEPTRCASVSIGPHARRCVQISASPALDPEAFASPSDQLPASSSPDARFEVLGAPFSLLSVSLSASQNLYTRRGTLVGLSGKAENVVSTLSILEPFRRAVVGVPFLYQKISSATPITALISTKSPITSFAAVHLDGRLDWMVAQRRALLAWTGQTLSATLIMKSLAHWGNSRVTGRGILGLAGTGQIFQVVLKSGEEYVAHPSNVLAYTLTQSPPLPYRLKALHLQVPDLNLSALVPDTRFFREMAKSQTWKTLSNLVFNIRTWARRSIWGDRLFLRFHGPTTILLQSRGSRMRDVLTTRDVNEIAETPPGSVQEAVTLKLDPPQDAQSSTSSTTKTAAELPTKMSYATVGGDRKVTFKDS